MKTDIRKAIATFALGAALMTVVPGTFAQGFGNTNHDSLIQKIIQKFGLKEADVRSVFDSFHQDRVNQMKTKNVDRLTQLVKDGKITEAQKKLMIAKQEEMQKNAQSQRDALKDKTPEQRKAIMDAKRAEIEKWAKDNGIDIQYLQPRFGRPGGHMGGRGMGMRGWNK
jgi:Skp family chaperone for outer membrane proteins